MDWRKRIFWISQSDFNVEADTETDFQIKWKHNTTILAKLADI